MNIWLSFVPGSAGSSIELILRSCTTLDCLPINEPVAPGFSTEPENGIVTAHGFRKQWHPTTKKALTEKKYIQAPDNIFTPIVPMSDMMGTEIIKYINKESGIKFYLGPKTDDSAEFAMITQQKICDHSTRLLEGLDLATWNNNIDALEKWEKREAISLHLLEWWIPQMKEQWDRAEQLGFVCIDTMDIFKNLKEVILLVIKSVQCDITDTIKFNKMCDVWQQGQNKIWKDWKNYINYREGKFSIIESEDVVHEAMIQWHLKQRGIELKCYGLNTFPNSKELKEYYE